jgi:hypothetical protein
MRRPVGISLELVVRRLALGQPQPPAIVVDDDADVIGVVKSGGAGLERSVAEPPLR